MGLQPIALRADTGAIGGDLSHEFHILADVGESAIYYDKKLDEIYQQELFHYQQNSGDKDDIIALLKGGQEIENINIDIKKLQSIYAMADDLHSQENCPVAKENIIAKRGIEVGQVFNFGLKYSKAMEASVMSASGEKIYPNMGSYGIGVSRVVAGAIEANHDERGIIWPAQIAPFDVMVINIKTGDEQCDLACAKIYENLQKHHIEVLYDDTKNSMGQKLAVADLIGVPYQIIVGPKTLANNQVEIKNRRNGEKFLVDISKVL